MQKNIQKYLNISVISVSVFLIIWEAVALFQIVDPIYIGTPHIILTKIFEILTDPKFLTYMSNSTRAFLVGYSLAVVLGVAIGLSLGVSKKCYQIFSPYVYIFNAIPYVALVPLLVIWLGLGVTAKTFIVFLMVISPMIVYTLDSVKTVDRKLIQMADSFGASSSLKYKKLYFYHALPYIFSGARVGIGRGLTAIVIAEIFGFGKGIAYYIPYYGATYQTDMLMATVIIIIVLNFLLITGLRKLQTKVVFWQ